MGLVGLTRVLSVEGAKHNIKANAIAPIARTRMTEELLGPMAEMLDPATVSPLVAWLVHEDCPVSGQIFSAAGGRIARMFIGLTTGWYDPDLTVEGVRDHWDEICDETGYVVPTDTSDELRQLLGVLGDRKG